MKGALMAVAPEEDEEPVEPGQTRTRSPLHSGMPDRLDLLWGLLSLRRTARGDEQIGVFWGLFEMRTRRARRAVAPSASPYEVAQASADERIEALRAAAVFGSLGLGFALVAFLSGGAFWRGIWTLTSVLLLALTSGQILSVLAERYRPRFVREEVERARNDSATRRELAGRHARDMQELTASIAHEIRNPITAAKSLVQQMGEDPGAEDNVEYASVALEELERVERSVSHLLRFARDEEVALAQMDLAEVVAGAVAALEERAAKNGVTLVHECDGPGFMNGDREQLRRVALNLVGNAIDALAEAKTLDAHVDVHMGSNLAGTELWLRVRDNGPGIPEEERARVFRPFHTTRQDGTGLGLAITKKIVEAHGGSIDIETAPAGGAQLVVSLPTQN
jgi:signal transduction histidine kinase